jgi:hypothetical protein
MNSDESHNPADRNLDAIFRTLRDEQPPYVEDAGGIGRLTYGFETRVAAQLRAERGTSWLSWAWKLCPFAAAVAIAAGAWAYTHADESPGTESVFDAVRLAGMPSIDFYLGHDE